MSTASGFLLEFIPMKIGAGMTFLEVPLSRSTGFRIDSLQKDNLHKVTSILTKWLLLVSLIRRLRQESDKSEANSS
jgi:hypothetical protein